MNLNKFDSTLNEIFIPQKIQIIGYSKNHHTNFVVIGLEGIYHFNKNIVGDTKQCQYTCNDCIGISFKFKFS